MKNQARLLKLMCVVVGLVLGGAGYYLARSVPDPDPSALMRPDDPGLSTELRQQMQLLNGEIRALNQSVTLLVESQALVTRVDPVDVALGFESPSDDELPATRRVAVQAPPEPKEQDWPKAIHLSLAGALVEYGLTPYDKGVNRILPEAARQMRERITEYEREMRELKEVQYPAVTSTVSPRYPDYDRARREITDSYEASKEKILESFREQLGTLASE